ncbi:MAG: hypothetical protein U1F53_24545 [Burkholderiaceae bacterium]
MPVCSVCGNDYARAFQVTCADGTCYTFDSLECAAHQIAPSCAHCGCRILGHGIEATKAMYCCASCARHAEGAKAVDHVAARPTA